MKYKLSLYNVSLSLLIAGSITGPAIYFYFPQMQLFRVALFFSLAVVFFMSTKKKLKKSNELLAVFFFFTVYFIYTNLISFLRISINIEDIVNFSFVYFLVVSTLLYVVLDSHRFVKVSYKTLMVMIFVMFFVSIWEIITHQHLSVSGSLLLPQYLSYTPTTFFTNQNDFSAVITLVVLFLAAYHKVMKKTLPLMVQFIWVVSFSLCFVTASRISMIVLLVTALVYWGGRIKLLHGITALVFLLVSFNLIKDYFLVGTIIDFDYLLSGTAVTGDSTSTRSRLLIDAFYSLSMNYGMGFGVNNSQEYYLMIGNTALQSTNPHNYLMEMLINSGFLIVFLFLLLNVYLSIIFLRKKLYFLVYLLFIYEIVLLNSSSSLFLWFHYVYYIGLVGLYKNYNSRMCY